MNFGLSKTALEKICGVFATLSKIDTVVIFGSRALGRQKEGSDIDLAVNGKGLCLDDILTVHLKLEDLMLPYRFDVVNLASGVDSDLKDHIERVGVIIYRRSQP